MKINLLISLTVSAGVIMAVGGVGGIKSLFKDLFILFLASEFYILWWYEMLEELFQGKWMLRVTWLTNSYHFFK